MLSNFQCHIDLFVVFLSLKEVGIVWGKNRNRYQIDKKSRIVLVKGSLVRKILLDSTFLVIIIKTVTLISHWVFGWLLDSPFLVRAPTGLLSSSNLTPILIAAQHAITKSAIANFHPQKNVNQFNSFHSFCEKKFALLWNYFVKYNPHYWVPT